MRPRIATAPWTRGPLLMLGERLALVAVVAATALLGLAVAGGPLFVASVGSGALHLAAARNCPQDDQVTVVNPPVADHAQPPAAVRAADPVVRAAFARTGLPAPRLSAHATVPAPATAPPGDDELGLFADDRALDHVQLVEGSRSRPGVYLPDTFARAAQLHAGDDLAVATGTAPVAGVYRDLDTASYRTVLPAFWCHWRSLIVTSVSSQPPPFLLTDRSTLDRLAGDVQAEWTSPVDVGGLTLAGAGRVLTAGRALFSADALSDDGTGPVAGFTVRTQLDDDLTRTRALQGAVTTPVTALTAAAGVLALALVGGAVLFWAQRRRAELRLLAARGVGPAALGLKAAAELGLPAAVGCAAGWAAARGAVPALGPSPLVEPGAPLRALLTAGVGWLACLLTAVAVGAVAGTERHRRPHPVLVRTALAAAVAVPIATGAVLLRSADLRQLALPGVHVVGARLLLAPVLALTGLVLAAALLAVALLPPARRRVGRPGTRQGRRGGVAVFTAVNRAAAAQGAVAAVVCGLAVPTGLAVYSSGFTAASAAAVQQKADTYTGADVVLVLRARLGELPDAGSAATPVSSTLADSLDRAGDQLDQVQLLGVDPATFTRYALGGDRVDRLVDRLRTAPAGAAAPALLVGDAAAPHALRVRSSTLPLRVVGRADVVPGMRYPGRATVVVPIGALTGLDPYGHWDDELWTDQRHVAGVLSELSARGVLTDDVTEPAGFVDAASLLPTTWTFDFLRAVSTLVAVVSVAGLLLYLGAREQRQAAATVLLRRMGLSRRAHLRSLLVELGSVGGWSWAAGCGTGVLALLVATRVVDVDPDFPPPPSLHVPLGTVLLSGVLIAAAAAGLSCWARHRADRTDAATVLRS